MEFNELIQTRRSVRSYCSGKTIERSLIEEIIKDTLLAPTWKNSQTGRYYVVDTPDKLSKVKESCLPEFNQKSSSNASALIITSFVKNIAGYAEGKPNNELGNEWGAYDLGLQNAYLILKSRNLGLDTLIMGIRDADKLREELSIPENEEIVSVIAIGYRDEEPILKPRKNLNEVVKFY